MKGLTLDMRWEVVECDQRSPEWVRARLGRLTGSTAPDIVRATKGGKPSTSRRNLMVRLALERITGRSLEKDFTSPAMQQGIERESAALCQYEAITGEVVRGTGFLKALDMMVGCSLDGHVQEGDRIVGIIEAKCPIPATHLEYLRTGEIPKDYRVQMNHNLLVTGADWCDWISYNPDFPEGLRAKLVRVERNQKELEDYAVEAGAFLEEIEQVVLDIHRLEADRGEVF